jgi:hypothetical protein
MSEENELPTFYSINSLVAEYPEAKCLTVFFMKESIKETITPKNKIHYVKPLAISVDGVLDKDIEWCFNIRDGDYVKIRKYDFFGIRIDCKSAQKKKLRDGTEIKFYKSEVVCITSEESINKLIDEPTQVTI